jgi:predicted secreted Zn-dependent protease
VDQRPAVLLQRDRIKSLVLSVGILAAAHCAAGDMRKCVGADGKVSYIDVPCPSAAKPARIQPPDSQSPAAITFGPWVQFFEVEGNEYEALLTSLSRRGPHGHHAMATWSISYFFQPVRSKGGCTPSKFEAKLEAKILMPRWTRRDGASADLIARWQRYETGLIAHEEAHLDHGRALVRALNREMQTFPPTKYCKELDKAVDAYIDEREKVYRKLDEEYDESTDHGLKLHIPAL